MANLVGLLLTQYKISVNDKTVWVTVNNKKEVINRNHTEILTTNEQKSLDTFITSLGMILITP